MTDRRNALGNIGCIEAVVASWTLRMHMDRTSASSDGSRGLLREEARVDRQPPMLIHSSRPVNARLDQHRPDAIDATDKPDQSGRWISERRACQPCAHLERWFCPCVGWGMDLLRAVPILTVTDVDSAVREYSELLGLDVLMNLGWVATLGTDGGAQFSVMDIDLSAPCNPQMSVEVPDVDDAYQRALDSGAEIVHPLQDEDWGVRRFFLRTSAGHVVNVLSHRG